MSSSNLGLLLRSWHSALLPTIGWEQHRFPSHLIYESNHFSWHSFNWHARMVKTILFKSWHNNSRITPSQVQAVKVSSAFLNPFCFLCFSLTHSSSLLIAFRNVLQIHSFQISIVLPLYSIFLAVALILILLKLSEWHYWLPLQHWLVIPFDH